MSDIRLRHNQDEQSEAFLCKDINGAESYLHWMVGDKHVNPLVQQDRADLLDCIAELEAELKFDHEEYKRLRGELKAKLDARCDHSELLHEIDELNRHNKVLQKADMHREKIWKKRVAELEADLFTVQKKRNELQAKLDAMQPLPDKWRKYTFDNPEATSYIDSADCADELEEALGEAK